MAGPRNKQQTLVCRPGRLDADRVASPLSPLLPDHPPGARRTPGTCPVVSQRQGGEPGWGRMGHWGMGGRRGQHTGAGGDGMWGQVDGTRGPILSLGSPPVGGRARVPG